MAGLTGSFLSRFYYPHRVFAKEILKMTSPGDKADLVDCPCGNGETSNLLALNSSFNVCGIDIEKKSIERAKKMYKRYNLSFKTDDIHQAVSNMSKVRYFTLINSLFLLPEPEKLIENIYSKILPGGKLMVVIPNIHGKNYQNFIQIGENAGINGFVLAEDEIEGFFRSYGFVSVHIKPIAFAHVYGRKMLKRLSLFANFFLLLESTIRRVCGGDGNYFLITLTKA